MVCVRRQIPSQDWRCNCFAEKRPRQSILDCRGFSFFLATDVAASFPLAKRPRVIHSGGYQHAHRVSSEPGRWKGTPTPGSMGKKEYVMIEANQLIRLALQTG